MTLPDKLKKGFMFHRVDTYNLGTLYYDNKCIETIHDLKKTKPSVLIDDWFGKDNWFADPVHVPGESDYYLIRTKIRAKDPDE